MAPGYHGARAADRSGSALVPRALLAYDWPPVPATTAFLFCVCQAGAEAAVAEELTALRPGLRRAFARPGLITFKDPSGEVPAEVAIEAVLVRAHGAAIGPAADVNALLAAVDKYCPKGQAVRLHVFERDIAKPGDEPPGHAYGPLTAAARAQIEAAWAAAPPRPLLTGERASAGDWVLDVIVAADEPWWLGFHRHGPGHPPTPGGRIRVDMPPEAPSRAYRKLEEALIWSRAPLRAGDTAVEIGSSPGGASYALLRRGVEVHGIDPAKMAPVVLDYNKDLPGNHFIHLDRPMSMVQRSDLPTALHWVLLDVNLAPQVALITARRLAAHPRPALMGVLLTLKLDDWKAMRHVPRFLKSIRSMGMEHVQATQLPSNRMELFVCGLTRRGVARLAAEQPDHADQPDHRAQPGSANCHTLAPAASSRE
jgi:23S rRNA (cytidine2498-2'-O)-methyltransferase